MGLCRHPCRELHRHQDHQHGQISAGSNFAIGVYGASAEIYNAGRITGFVDLTNSDDIFINQKGGVFETKLTSYFGLGNDLFVNEQGGTVLAATNPSVKETSGFRGARALREQGANHPPG
jgi:hypothetical protein